jgi:hypothetical protein
MKYLLIVLFSLASFTSNALDLTNVVLTPVGVLKTKNFVSRSTWGAGLDLGYRVNSAISLHTVAISYDSPDNWRGATVDETDLLLRVRISPLSTDSFSLYGLGSGQRDWTTHSWGLGLGLGASFSLSKNLSLIGDYSIRSWFSSSSRKDSLARFGLALSF